MGKPKTPGDIAKLMHDLKEKTDKPRTGKCWEAPSPVRSHRAAKTRPTPYHPPPKKACSTCPTGCEPVPRHMAATSSSSSTRSGRSSAAPEEPPSGAASSCLLRRDLDVLALQAERIERARGHERLAQEHVGAQRHAKLVVSHEPDAHRRHRRGHQRALRGSSALTPRPCRPPSPCKSTSPSSTSFQTPASGAARSPCTTPGTTPPCRPRDERFVLVRHSLGRQLLLPPLLRLGRRSASTSRSSSCSFSIVF